jgi:hypothetical protein
MYGGACTKALGAAEGGRAQATLAGTNNFGEDRCGAAFEPYAVAHRKMMRKPREFH